MGYYTKYELRVKIYDNSSDEAIEEIIAQLREENKSAAYALNDHGDTSDSTKWYDYEEDMKAFSKKHPRAIFHLFGTGEEHGDMWRATFIDGKMHRRQAQITFADFDPNKLE